MRYAAVRDLVRNYADSGDHFQEADGYYFASVLLVSDNVFPQMIHDTLARLRVPYNFSYELSGEWGGGRGGGWRPGMKARLEYWVLDDERAFTASEIESALTEIERGADPLQRLRNLFEEEDRVLTRWTQWPDPRANRALALRAGGRARPSSVRRRVL